MNRLLTDKINDHSPYDVGEGKTEYVALLAQRNRPDIDKILLRFDEEVAMFNSMKP